MDDVASIFITYISRLIISENAVNLIHSPGECFGTRWVRWRHGRRVEGP
jgi:hypothetical protein